MTDELVQPRAPSARERLVLPLDVPDLVSAQALIALLKSDVGVFKVGLELFTAVGPDAVRAVHDAGAACFLDLKLHDIPATMAKATASAARLGVRFLTVHAAAGPSALRAVAAEAGDTTLLAVTVLTSMDDAELLQVGLAGPAAQAVERLGALSVEAGVGGLVCSPLEVGLLRNRLGSGPALMVPGVRPAGAAVGDQKRVATPASAIRDGADYLVVGRPIRDAEDPVAAARAVVAEIEGALAARSRVPRVKRILTGPRFVAEALRSGARQQVHVVYVHEGDSESLREVRMLAEKGKVRVEERPRAVLDDLAKGVKHQGVVAITGDYPYVDMAELQAQAGPCPLFVALDSLTDPHNFGAIVRSAVAFGAHGILIPKHNSVSVTPVVVRVSAGATERARIVRVTNLQRTLMSLRDDGLQIVGLDGDGDTSIYALPEAPQGRVLVIGSEGEGMRRMVRERCDLVAHIPITGEAESLNASVAAGIALAEARRQQLAAGSAG